MKLDSKRWRALIAVTFGLLSCVATLDIQPAGAIGPTTQANALPDAEGKGLVLASCTQCHNLGSIVAQRKSGEAWQRTVQDMVSRGAQVRQEEILLITDYLAKSFGPGAHSFDASTEPAVTGPSPSSGSPGSSGIPASSLPAGPERALVLRSCTECHGLNRITEQHKSEPGWRAAVKDMVRLGAKVKPAEAEAVITYLASNFGPAREVAASAAVTVEPNKPADPARMLPDGEGKGLVLATCVECHGLQEITGQRKDAEGWKRTVEDMVSRGAQITPEEANLIASYLARSMSK